MMTTSIAVVNFKSILAKVTEERKRSSSPSDVAAGRDECLDGAKGGADIDGLAHSLSGLLSRKVDASANGVDRHSRSASDVAAATASSRVTSKSAPVENMPVGIDVLELFYTVVSLYDCCLPNTETEDIYSTVTASSTRTILLYMDTPSAIEECKKAYNASHKKHGTNPRAADAPEEKIDASKSGSAAAEVDEEEDTEEGEEEESALAAVFSDSDFDEEDDDEADSEDSDDEVDYQFGLDEFLTKVHERRRLRKCGRWGDESVSVESRLAAALTFKWILHNEDEPPLVQVCLLAVRPRFRKRGLGAQLMKCLKDPSTTGAASIFVAYVDDKAKGFFNRHQFLDDVVLCSKYIDSVDPWFNSTFMCCVRSQLDVSDDPIGTSMDALINLDIQMKEWRRQHVTGYQQQLQLQENMKEHILLLQLQINSKQSTIVELTTRLESALEAKDKIEEEFKEYRKRMEGRAS